MESAGILNGSVVPWLLKLMVQGVLSPIDALMFWAYLSQSELRICATNLTEVMKKKWKFYLVVSIKLYTIHVHVGFTKYTAIWHTPIGSTDNGGKNIYGITQQLITLYYF